MSAQTEAPETLAVSAPTERLAARREERREAAVRRRRRRRRLAVLLGVVVLLSPAVYSYSTTMLQPSSLPLGVRSVEWLRAHHGNWLVDEVESVYYGWKAPKKGGPQLKTLPAVGVSPAATAVDRRRAAAACRAWPPRIKPVFAHPSARRRGWERTGPLVNGRPARPRHHLPHRARLSAHRRLRRLVRPHADRARLLPRPLRAAERARARADVGSARPALAPARHLQRRLHVHRRPQRLVDQRPRSTSRSRTAWPR